MLLRVTLGAALVGQGARSALEGLASPSGGALDLLAILTGSALVAGTLTPAAGLASVGLSLLRPVATTLAPGARGLEGGAALALLAVMGLTVALLGPGAYSVDARLFGRREILVPRRAPGRSPDAP